MNTDIEISWEKVLDDYLKSEKFQDLMNFLDTEYKTKTIYPESKNMFNALNLTPFNDVSVVIIGQDPYHNPDQAHGLCFSVPEGINPPPSLKNISKEIKNDLNIEKDMAEGNLTAWAEQGVLLLNSVLTVEKNKPGSHAKMGWEDFTDDIIKKISDQKEHCVFILWGNYARQKGSVIDREKHLVLESVHPSPFSAYNGFFGNNHFSKTNDYLKKHNKKEINW